MQVPSGPTAAFSTLSPGQTFWGGSNLYIKTNDATNNAVNLATGATGAFAGSDPVTPQAGKFVSV